MFFRLTLNLRSARPTFCKGIYCHAIRLASLPSACPGAPAPAAPRHTQYLMSGRKLAKFQIPDNSRSNFKLFNNFKTRVEFFLIAGFGAPPCFHSHNMFSLLSGRAPPQAAAASPLPASPRPLRLPCQGAFQAPCAHRVASPATSPLSCADCRPGSQTRHTGDSLPVLCQGNGSVHGVQGC